MSAIATSPVVRTVGAAQRWQVRPAAQERLRGAEDRTRGRLRGAEGRGGAVGLRLTTRGRVVLGVLGALLVTAVGLLLSPLLASGAVADGPTTSAVEVERHVVQPGETLWAIASDVAAPGEDVRDVVLALQRLNNLPTAGLMAGQAIVVPVD